MNPFEYAVGLFSIVVGLAIADMGNSAHKLVRHRSTIRWDGRVIAVAVLIFLTVTGMWFQFWYIRARVEILTYPFFLSLIVEMLLAYLMAAAALPDSPEPGCDLHAFYEGDGRSIWTLYALFQTSFLAHWVYFATTHANYTAESFVWRVPLALLPLCAALVLAAFPRVRWLHYGVIVLLTIRTVQSIWFTRLA